MPNCHRAMSSGSITQPSRTTTCCSTTNRSKEFPAHGYAKVLGRSHSAIDHTSDGGSAEPRRALPGREDHPPDLAFLRVPPRLSPAGHAAGRGPGVTHLTGHGAWRPARGRHREAERGSRSPRYGAARAGRTPEGAPGEPERRAGWALSPAGGERPTGTPKGRSGREAAGRNPRPAAIIRGPSGGEKNHQGARRSEGGKSRQGAWRRGSREGPEDVAVGDPATASWDHRAPATAGPKGAGRRGGAADRRRGPAPPRPSPGLSGSGAAAFRPGGGAET